MWSEHCRNIWVRGGKCRNIWGLSGNNPLFYTIFHNNNIGSHFFIPKKNHFYMCVCIIGFIRWHNIQLRRDWQYYHNIISLYHINLIVRFIKIYSYLLLWLSLTQFQFQSEDKTKNKFTSKYISFGWGYLNHQVLLYTRCKK